MGTPVRPWPSFTNRLIQMVLLLSNSMHRPQTHLHLVPMELCKRGEDVLWNLSPTDVKPSNWPAPFKYNSTTPGNYLTGNTLLTKALTHLLAWSKADPERHSSTWDRRYSHCCHQGHRCPVPGSLQQSKQRGSFLHAQWRRSRRVLHRLQL